MAYISAFLLYKKIYMHKRKEVNDLTQEELREMYIETLKREKQVWISSATGINKDTLSKFKRGKIDLYPHLFEKLEEYLVNNN